MGTLHDNLLAVEAECYAPAVGSVSYAIVAHHLSALKGTSQTSGIPSRQDRWHRRSRSREVLIYRPPCTSTPMQPDLRAPAETGPRCVVQLLKVVKKPDVRCP